MPGRLDQLDEHVVHGQAGLPVGGQVGLEPADDERVGAQEQPPVLELRLVQAAQTPHLVHAGHARASTPPAGAAAGTGA